MKAAVEVGAGDVFLDRFTHGTTIATNALLERKGARTAFVGTAGFEHVLHLRRQTRAHLYRLCDRHPEPLVPAGALRRRPRAYGPGRRRRAARPRLAPGARRRGGGDLPPLLLPRPDATSALVADEVRRRLPDAHVVASHEVAPEFREYERASTTAVDAYLGPVARRVPVVAGGPLQGGRPRAAAGHALVGRRLHARRGRAPSVFRARLGPCRGRRRRGAGRRRSPGSTTRSRSTWAAPPPTSASSPAAGPSARPSASSAASRSASRPSICRRSEREAARSCWRDAGGALRVGPQSAGADPGPACYGRGGLEPTVTDANLRAGPAAGRARGRARARPRLPPSCALGDFDARGRDRRRQRRDAARAPARLGRARPRPARLRSRRLRRRRPAARVRARRRARHSRGARPRGGRRALRARPRRERGAA